MIVPILMECDSWHAMSLLDAHMIKNRLQAVAPDIIPESQCRFGGAIAQT